MNGLCMLHLYNILYNKYNKKKYIYIYININDMDLWIYEAIIICNILKE